MHFNGSLAQDLHGHAYSSEFRGERVHDLIFNPEFGMLEIELLKRWNKNRKKKDDRLATCSLHHQGAYEDNVPDCFDIIAKTEDGVVEVIKHKTLPIAGGQMHVEEDYNPLCNHLIKQLIKQSPNFQNEDQRKDSTIQGESGSQA